MKTVMPNGDEHTFTLRSAAGFVSGDVIEMRAADLNLMVKLLRTNPTRFAAQLEQLRMRFPQNRVQAGPLGWWRCETCGANGEMQGNIAKTKCDLSMGQCRLQWRRE